MQLLQHVTLVYQQGRTERVYEIDLCEVGPGRYVVNFRYGRRWTRLQEGTQTTTPVARDTAERLFQDLVAAQLQKGYRHREQPPAAPPAPAPAPAPVTPAVVVPSTVVAPSTVGVPSTDDARAQAILRRLAAAPAERASTRPQRPARFWRRRPPRDVPPWPLERAIWRAGELRLHAAVPLLLRLLGSGNALRDYCLVWALGWCGDTSTIAPMTRLYTAPATPDMVRRIACEALLKLSDEATRDAFRTDTIAQLPPPLRDLAQRGPAAAFTTALQAYLQDGGEPQYATLETLYRIDNAHVRPALLEVLRTIPLQPPAFRQVRHLFKMAEYRRDAEVFGLLAYRFQKQPGVRNAPAYRPTTRMYLLRRVWRTLRRMGALGETEYVKMAVGVLLPYTDADAVPIREHHAWRNRRHIRLHWWDAYAPYLTFNHVLYTHSQRYFLPPGVRAWRCPATYQQGSPEPPEREEAFPHLWDQMPVGLLHLLAESQCRPVHHFAIKALQTLPTFCASLDLDALAMLLSRPYDVTVRFALPLVTQRYQPDQPHAGLLLALASCLLPEARVYGRHWIEAQREWALHDSALIAGLVLSPHADTRAFVRRLLLAAPLPDAVAQPLIARLLAALLALPEAEAAQAQEAAETLRLAFALQVRTLGLEVIRDLLAHPLPVVQTLGAEILLTHAVPASDLPSDLLQLLLTTPHDVVRVLGLRLLGQIPEAQLLRHDRLLVELVAHPMAEVRDTIRPLIRQLAQATRHPTLVAQLTLRCIEALLTSALPAETHSAILTTLRQDVQGWEAGVAKDTAFRLLQAKASAAQAAGGLVLAARREEWQDEFDLAELVPLSTHDVRAVRQAAWGLITRLAWRCRRATNPAGYAGEMAKAVRLLDASWDDAREYWSTFFREQFQAEDFTPATLVSLCDSPRPTVQQFGRSLLAAHFQEADGPDYMLKFSEHPSADMQLFVTNFLERYAADQPERLRELRPYFLSTLSLVNRGRVAKDRVLAFLLAEARKSAEVASLVAEILTRQSVTMAIGDKATMIAAMLQLHRAYPDLPLPLQVQPVPQRGPAPVPA